MQNTENLIISKSGKYSIKAVSHFMKAINGFIAVANKFGDESLLKRELKRVIIEININLRNIEYNTIMGI